MASTGTAGIQPYRRARRCGVGNVLFLQLGKEPILKAAQLSIGVGKNGPTHQPVEILVSLRAMPNMLVMRPADAVDEADLVTALDEGLISGAGFDVADGEPPSMDSPLMRVASRHNVIVTPHVAWASNEAQQTLADQLTENIERFVEGAPANVV